MLSVSKGNRVSYENLQFLGKKPVTKPARAGGYWRGLKHIDLVDGIQQEAENRGWDITKSTFALSKDKADLAATFSLAGVPKVKLPKGISLELGLMTSNALRRMTRLTVGGTVAVCLNGLITGEVVMEKKHSKYFDLEAELKQGFNQYVTKAKLITDEVGSMQSWYISDNDALKILAETGRQHILPWSHIGMIDKLYNNPIHNEFKEKTTWSLLNAFTSVVKKSPPIFQMSRMLRFHNLLKTEGFLAA
jgi:hypothetical protein